MFHSVFVHVQFELQNFLFSTPLIVGKSVFLEFYKYLICVYVSLVHCISTDAIKTELCSVYIYVLVIVYNV